MELTKTDITGTSRVRKKPEEKVEDTDEKMMEVEVRSTKFLLQTFLQAVKAYRIYEANHPILSKFLDRLERDFDHYFDEFDSFSLQVGEHQLFFRGKVVYQSQDVKESLAFFFYRDGIREIRFHKGLEAREVYDFLSIVRRSDLVNRMEDDLVTLLWEKDFSHISFTSMDDFLESGATFVPATEEDFTNGLEYKGSWEEGFLEADGAKTEEPDALEAEGLKKALNLSPNQSLVQACQLTPDEMEAVNKEAQQEQQPDYIYVLIDNLIEILLHLGEDLDAYENMISYFERIIKSLLEQGDVARAVMILKDLSDTLESMVLKDKQIFAIRRIIEASSGPHPIELLRRAMKSTEQETSEAILQYLKLLTRQAIDPLCLLLGELESGKWRKVVCDRLAELCGDEIQPLTRYLSDPNPFLVSHILYVLGKTEHPSTLKYLGGLTGYPDAKIRDETLKLIAKFEEKGKDLIQKFLKDPSPEIRGKASYLFAKAAKAHAVKPLMAIILSDDFYRRGYDEKASFFKALGETGSEEAIPALRKIAKKRRWFKRAQWDEMRLCATNTLKMMGVEKG
jgi:hypothetical protein